MSSEKRPYAQRLRQERVRLGLAQAQLAAVGSVSKATQTAYESDLHVPNLEYLSAVSSLGIDEVFVMKGKSSKDFIESEFDWDLLGDITEAISEWCEEHNRQIPREKLRDLMRMLYREFANSGVIDGEVMARALRIAA